VVITEDDIVEDSAPITEEKLLPIIDISKLLTESIEDASLGDTGFMAKKMIEELKAAGHKISMHSIPAAEVFLSFEKGLKQLKKHDIGVLPKVEYNFWYGVLQSQLVRLAELLKK